MVMDTDVMRETTRKTNAKCLRALK